jgi:hypothetical protein
MKKLIFLLLILPYILNSCKDCCEDASNPECENYDPCFNYPSANADFGIYELLGDYESETDTVYNFNKVLFKPKNKQDKVTWLLGEETISINELIRENYPPGYIEVTMMAEMNPNSCRSTDQQNDTLTKRFYVVQIPLDSNDYMVSPWWGTWEGYNTDASNDKFTVSWGFINSWGQPYVDFTGLPKGIPAQKPFYSHSNSICTGIEYNIGYKDVVFTKGRHQDYGGFGLNGTCHRDGSTVVISYNYNNRPYQNWLLGEKEIVEPLQWVSKTFTGKKISNKVKTQ